jgi:hypothetical protein
MAASQRDNANNSTGTAIRLAVAIVICLLGAYLGGYFIRGYGTITTTSRLRIYRTRIETRIFVPLAWVEAKLSRDTVDLAESADGSANVFIFRYRATP